MSRLLTFADGEIRLAGELVPGILSSLRVDGKVRFDEQAVDGASGTKKIPLGYEDCAVSLGLFLLTDEQSTCYDKLAQVSAMFKSLDDKANPKIFDVANRHLLARGVRQVVFFRLESAEDTYTDEIRATLSFLEHNPPIIRTEQAEAKTPTPAEAAEEDGQEPQEAVVIQVDAS